MQNTNGTAWSGLVGAVIDQQADLAVAALSITPEREEVIDFTVPFLETGITIVVAIREGAISPTAFLGNNSSLFLPPPLILFLLKGEEPLFVSPVMSIFYFFVRI